MKKKTGKSLDILKNIRNFAPFSGMRGSHKSPSFVFYKQLDTISPYTTEKGKE